jgi:hypothetical protein
MCVYLLLRTNFSATAFLTALIKTVENGDRNASQNENNPSQRLKNFRFILNIPNATDTRFNGIDLHLLKFLETNT